MAVDFDWRRHSAPAYLDAYERAVEIRRVAREAPRPARGGPAAR
jgi:hypothetical protein